jgi:pyrroloquinoline quinone biosynthesis protein B
LEMEAASAGPHPPSEEETVSKNLFEAKLKEYLVAAGPKSKLMSKARYDQTIQTIETEKGQFVGSVSRAYQIRKEYDVINIKDRKILYKRSSNAEFDGRAPVDDLCRVAHEEEVYELLRLHHDELTLHGSARKTFFSIRKVISNISQEICGMYQKLCPYCQGCKRPNNNTSPHLQMDAAHSGVVAPASMDTEEDMNDTDDGNGDRNVTVLLLGVAQDGGYPQFGCVCANCRACYSGQTQPETAVSLALLDSTTKKWWLVDATPQLCQQWLEFAGILSQYELAGVILTHAHVGHYPGLLYFGKEAKNTSRIPLYASPTMHNFLKSNEPWGVMYRNENFVQVDLDNGVPIQLTESLAIIPQSVVHRADFTDTFAFTIQGRSRKLFYCPDIDSWEGLSTSLPAVAQNNDILLLDATFYDDNELPGRDMSKIPHPRIRTTVDILTANGSSSTGKEVVLIHINHSNRTWTDHECVKSLLALGIQVGRKGQKWRI